MVELLLKYENRDYLKEQKHTEKKMDACYSSVRNKMPFE